MKKTLHIDEKLLQEARTASRAATDTETVRMGLGALVAMSPMSAFALCGAPIPPRATCRTGENNLRAGVAVHKWSLSIHRSGSVSWLEPNLTMQR